MNEPSFLRTKPESFRSRLNLQVSNYFCAVFMILIGSLFATQARALEINFNIAGNAQNQNLYGTAADPFTGGWGTRYYDFTFKLIAPSTVSFSSFNMQVTVNKGGATTTPLNASLFSGPIVANPNSNTLLGTASINSSAVSTSFTQLLIGPSSTLSPTMDTAVSPGAQYFIRLWSTGSGTTSGFGLKVASDPLIQYSTSNGTVSMMYYNGTSFVSSSSFSPVPETSSMLMGGLAMSSILLVRVYKKRQARAIARTA